MQQRSAVECTTTIHLFVGRASLRLFFFVPLLRLISPTASFVMLLFRAARIIFNGPTHYKSRRGGIHFLRAVVASPSPSPNMASHVSIIANRRHPSSNFGDASPQKNQNPKRRCQSFSQTFGRPFVTRELGNLCHLGFVLPTAMFRGCEESHANTN